MPCSYVDFFPQTLAPGGMFSAPTVEGFSTLVDRANAYFSTNHAMIPFSCESCEQAVHRAVGGYQNGADMDRSCYIEYGNTTTTYVRYLRVWCRVRDANDPPPPAVLGCMTVVPAQLAQGGFLSSPEYEDYNTTINKVNDMFRANPLPGRILNVETQDMKLYSGNRVANTDLSLWYEHGDHTKMYINVVRIFYMAGPPAYELISTIDFCPSVSSHKMFMGINMPVGQPLSELMTAVNTWMATYPGNRIINIQTINFKTERGGLGGPAAVNTHRTFFYVRGNFHTTYMRVIRIHFTTTGTAPVPRPITCITYRTFIPMLLSMGGFSLPNYETMAQTMNRAVAWLQQTGVRPIAAETVPVLMYYQTHEPPAFLSEKTITTQSGQRNDFFVLCLRLYFDTPYQEPPPEVLPPVPQAQVSQGMLCCSVL